MADSPHLTAGSPRLIEAADAVYVSAASVWELAIKVRLGKIDVDLEAFVAGIGNNGFLDLPVTAAHAAAVSQLPMHHNDPFDRLLVAQALAETLKLVTADQALLPYSNRVLLV